MFSYVARQAILDREKDLFSYELLFRDGEKNCFPDISPDEATSRILTNNHLDLGLQAITGDKLAFINFHQDTLLHRFPTSLDPTRVVIEIVETVAITPELIEACISLKKMGYQLALDDFEFNAKWEPLLVLADIVKIDIDLCNQTKMRASIDKLKQLHIKLVAEKIETEAQFEEYKALGFDYFQGYFFARPEIVKQKCLPTNKLPLLELIAVSAAAEFDFAKVNEIISKDVSLSYKLLRFINNPSIDKNNKIISLKHAITYMGENEVKKFIALVALANLGADKTFELLHLSLVRAKFCELLGTAKKRSVNPPTGFLVGLFSLLDALLDEVMPNIVNRLPIDDELKQALCGQPGELNHYLMLTKAYETADWTGVENFTAILQLDASQVQDFYFQSLDWANIMKSLFKEQ